jgi:hypothetical protein
VADTEVGASEARLRDMQPQPQYTSWNPQSTRVLIDLYQKHKSKVGTLQLRNIKKLFELIAKEINICWGTYIRLTYVSLTHKNAHASDTKFRDLSETFSTSYETG